MFRYNEMTGQESGSRRNDIKWFPSGVWRNGFMINQKRKGKEQWDFKFLGNAFADGMEDTYDKIARKTDDPEIMLDAIEHKQRLRSTREAYNAKDDDDDYDY